MRRFSEPMGLYHAIVPDLYLPEKDNRVFANIPEVLNTRPHDCLRIYRLRQLQNIVAMRSALGPARRICRLDRIGENGL